MSQHKITQHIFVCSMGKSLLLCMSDDNKGYVFFPLLKMSMVPEGLEGVGHIGYRAINRGSLEIS